LRSIKNDQSTEVRVACFTEVRGKDEEKRRRGEETREESVSSTAPCPNEK
jgi:hypothetical protein